MISRRRAASIACFLFFLFIAACGGGGGSDGGSSDGGGDTPAKVTDVTNLEIVDNVVGTGSSAGIGRMVSIYYTGYLYDPDAVDFHGKQFDRVVSGAPFTFTLGAGEVIQGFDQGLRTMKEGGSRTLIIPSRLAYGRQGNGPIPPNSAVVFEIDLLSVD